MQGPAVRRQRSFHPINAMTAPNPLGFAHVTGATPCSHVSRSFPVARIHAFAALLAVWCAAAAPVDATAQTWLWNGGSAADSNWSSGDNWVGGVAPAPGASTIISMDGTVRTSNTQNIANPFQLNRLNILNTGTNGFNIGGSQLQFVADGATQPRIFSNRNATSTISAPVNIGTGTNLQLEFTTFHVNFNGVISGDATLEKLNNSGGFNLNNGANSFTGGVIYRNFGGANGSWNLFRVTQSGALGSGLVQLDGGNLNAWDSSTNNRPGGLIFNGNNLTFANDFLILRDSPIFVGEPWNGAHNNNSATLTGDIDLNGNTLTLRGRTTTSGTITGTISGAGGVRKIEPNIWTLSGPNSYTGPTSILGGTLSTDSIANGGVASGLGASSNAAANLVINNSTLSYTGATTSTDRRFTLSGNARFDVADPNTTLTFQSIQGSSFGGGGTTITKDGPGTLVFGRTGGGSTYLASIGAFAILEGSLLNLASAPVQINVNRQSGAGAALTLGDGANLGIFTPLEVTGANTDQLVRYTGTTSTATISAPSLTIGGPGSADPVGAPFNTKTFEVANGAADVDLRVTSNMTLWSGGGGNPPAVTRIIKTGEGTLDLTGNNLYRGGTTVAEGRLLINNTAGSGTGTGDVLVESGAVFGGTGTISPGSSGLTIESGGTLAPGNSPGTFTVNGDVLFGAGSFFEVDLAIGGVAATSTNGTTGTDLLVVNNGNISLDGALLTGTWGGDGGNIFRGDLTSDTMLWIMNNTGQDPIDGTFANSAPAPGFAGLFNEPSASPYLTEVDGQVFALFYDADFTSGALFGGNDMLLLAVPEPGRALLVTLSLVLLASRRRRA